MVRQFGGLLGFALADADSADFDGGQLVVKLSNNGGFDDRLDVRN